MCRAMLYVRQVEYIVSNLRILISSETASLLTRPWPGAAAPGQRGPARDVILLDGVLAVAAGSVIAGGRTNQCSHGERVQTAAAWSMAQQLVCQQLDQSRVESLRGAVTFRDPAVGGPSTSRQIAVNEQRDHNISIAMRRCYRAQSRSFARCEQAKRRLSA
jgi:hypothetical protein